MAEVLLLPGDKDNCSCSYDQKKKKIKLVQRAFFLRPVVFNKFYSFFSTEFAFLTQK